MATSHLAVVGEPTVSAVEAGVAQARSEGCDVVIALDSSLGKCGLEAVGGIIEVVLGFWAAGYYGRSAVLLVACLNLGNMLLARGSARDKEMAIRVSMEEGRAQEEARVKAAQAEAAANAAKALRYEIAAEHGIPLALKDLYETAWVLTTAGSKFFRDYVPHQDGACVERLVAAGAGPLEPVLRPVLWFTGDPQQTGESR